MRFDINPIAKPRMTNSDRWNKRPAVTQYWQFKDALQGMANQANFTLPTAYTVTFYLPMPQSWSKAKKLTYLGKPHKQKPDLDNLIKALNDSLLPDNDTGVWCIVAKKLWSTQGLIIVEPL